MSMKETGENEILAEARARAEAAARVAADKRKNWQIGALGAAIGSAAVAGAVLYARRRDRD